MSHYTKERNIIEFHIDGVNGVYRLNLDNGEFLGLKGSPIKTNCKASAIRDMLRRSDSFHGGWSHLERSIYNMMNQSSGTMHFPRWVAILKGAERLDAIDMEWDWLSSDNYQYINENFAHITEYRRSLEAENTNPDYNSFYRFVEYKKAIAKLGSNLAQLLTPEMFCAVNSHYPTASKEEWEAVAYYLVRGKMWEYEHHDVSNLIHYFTVCKAMEKQPQKVNNFMREYVETMREYELRKTEFDNKRIVANYDLHANAFEFSFGGFTVIRPTCGQDIIDEGRNMHHCVGSYVGRVVNNETYIVFIRREDAPDQCYLTCQVDTYGNIRQYYLAYDRTISSAEDRAFKTAFQNHLLANWTN